MEDVCTFFSLCVCVCILSPVCWHGCNQPSQASFMPNRRLYCLQRIRGWDGMKTLLLSWISSLSPQPMPDQYAAALGLHTLLPFFLFVFIFHHAVRWDYTAVDLNLSHLFQRKTTAKSPALGPAERWDSKWNIVSCHYVVQRSAPGSGLALSALTGELAPRVSAACAARDVCLCFHFLAEWKCAGKTIRLVLFVISNEDAFVISPLLATLVASLSLSGLRWQQEVTAALSFRRMKKSTLSVRGAMQGPAASHWPRTCKPASFYIKH